MENSDSIITSLLKQESGACGHKKCVKENRKICQVVYAKALRKKYRDQGLPWWQAARYTPTGYLACLVHSRKHRKTSDEAKVTNKKYNDKCLELYGGRPNQNTVARGRWILARENISPDNS